MTMLLLALLSVQAVQGVDLTQLETPGDMVDFIQEIQAKSSESEQEVLKTLLGDRAKWHPEAPLLLGKVQARGSRGRRLAGQMYCDGGTEAVCLTQSDSQCRTCKWSYSCSENSCSDYDDQSACCANAQGVATGCMWQTGYSSGRCVPKTCDDVIGFYSGLSDNTAKAAACNAMPGCAAFCSASDQTVTCQVGTTADWDCTCDGSTQCTAKQTNTGGTVSAEQAGNAIITALTQKCTSTDCAKCIGSSSTCLDKKTKVATGGSCHEQCGTLAQCDAEVECMFCGQKNSSSCTAAQPVLSSCQSITLSDTTTTTSMACVAECAAINARCPSSCSGSPAVEYSCVYNPGAGTSGAIRSGAMVITLLVALVLGGLY